MCYAFARLPGLLDSAGTKRDERQEERERKAEQQEEEEREEEEEEAKLEGEGRNAWGPNMSEL